MLSGVCVTCLCTDTRVVALLRLWKVGSRMKKKKASVRWRKKGKIGNANKTLLGFVVCLG